MPRNSRKLLGEILCHHMVQGINREHIFKTEEDKRKYLFLMRKYYEKFKVDIIAYCIMDNHSHMLLYSNEIQNISNFMKQVNSIYAMYYNKNMQRVGYVYRNRFKSVPIMNKEQLYTCIKYIHMNPVKAGIVKKESDYIFSSYNDFINKTGFIDERILKFIFSSTNNYIEKFQSIEYKELNKEKTNLKEILEDFLIIEKIDFEQIKKNKIKIKKFIFYLISNQYEFSKREVAEVFNISRSTLYRWLYDWNDKKRQKNETNKTCP